MTDRQVPDRRPTDRQVPDRRPTDRLNLSRRPFVNSRPVTRAAALLWVLGTVLLLTNVFIIWSYLASSREKRAEVKSGEAGLAAERQAVARHEEQVARLDLGRQNEEVAYLNGKIAQRTFSWSRLFDRLAEVLPADVRLQQLTPRGLADERQERQAVRRPATRRATDLVTLQINGQAKSVEAILEFVDNLFAHPAFAEPNLTHQAHEKDGYIRFAVGVTYLPNAAVAGPVKPPARRWKLAPEPGSQALQAVPPPGLSPPSAPPPVAPGDLRARRRGRPAARRPAGRSGRAARPPPPRSLPQGRAAPGRSAAPGPPRRRHAAGARHRGRGARRRLEQGSQREGRRAMSSPEIWRQRVWVWLPALVFFLLNLAAFAVYRLGYAGNIQSLETELDGQHHELATLKARQRELDSLLLRADANRRRVEELYDDRFSTRRRRLTEVTAEVLSLARRAGLEPEVLAYP